MVSVPVARIKKFGNAFEISVDTDAALRYKAGDLGDLRDVLHADAVFTDAKKGLVASDSELTAAFGTNDPLKIADIILKDGEIQGTSEHRSAAREQFFRKLVHEIHVQAINPQTKLPHPVTRIEAGLEEVKVKIDYNKTVDSQFEDVIKQLRVVLPLSIAKKQLTVLIPATYSGKAYAVVTSRSKLIADAWLTDGSWKADVELPAGKYAEFLEVVASLTHGGAQVEEK